MNAIAYYYAGRLSLRMNNKPLAIERLKKSLVLEPGFGGARELLSQAGVDPDQK